MRRESYSNRFATALEGVDIDNPGTALDRSGHPNPVPRVVGPVARRHPVQVRDLAVPARDTSRTIKFDGAGAVHDVPAGPGRLLRRRPTSSAWPTRTRSAARSSTCSRPAPTSSRSTSPTCRRGPSAARDYGLDVAAPRAPTASPARARCTSASATRRSSTSARAATRSCPSWRRPSATRSASRPRSRGSTLDVLDALAGEDDHPGRARPVDRRGRDAGTVAERIRRAFPHARPGAAIAAPDCGMKYLARLPPTGRVVERAVERLPTTPATADLRRRHWSEIATCSRASIDSCMPPSIPESMIMSRSSLFGHWTRISSRCDRRPP